MGVLFAKSTPKPPQKPLKKGKYSLFPLLPVPPEAGAPIII